MNELFMILQQKCKEDKISRPIDNQFLSLDRTLEIPGMTMSRNRLQQQIN